MTISIRGQEGGRAGRVKGGLRTGFMMKEDNTTFASARKRFFFSLVLLAGGVVYSIWPVDIIPDILGPFENSLQKDRCPFGRQQCSDENPCAAHQHWRPLREAYIRFMDQTTLEQVAAQERSSHAQPTGASGNPSAT